MKKRFSKSLIDSSTASSHKMSNSSQGITFGKKIAMIEDTVVQQQSFIAKILQTIQTFLQNDTNKQSNKALTKQFNQIIEDFQQQQDNFGLNTSKDLDLFSSIDSNNQKINEHQNKIDDIDSELKAIKYLLNNLKDGAPSDDDFQRYKQEIAEIENKRTKNQMEPLITSVKCLKYEVKKMKDNYLNLQPQKNISETSNDYSELNHEIESMKYEIKKLKEALGNNNVSGNDKNATNQSNIQTDDPALAKIYSELYKVRDDLKEEINSLQEEAAPLLNEETRKFPAKLKEFKRELKQMKKIQEDTEKTISDLQERQEKIFRKLKKLRDEKINPLDEKVDKLQSSFDSLEEKDQGSGIEDIITEQNELKEKIDQLTNQLNNLKDNQFEQNAISQAQKDLQNLKEKVVDVEIPVNTTNSTEEDSDDAKKGNVLDDIRDLKTKVKELETKNKRQAQSINQLLDNSNSLNNSSYENLESRIQELEKRLTNFEPISSNIQNEVSANKEFIDNFSQKQNEMNRSINCLKYELKKLKTKSANNNDTKIIPTERDIDLTNKNNDVSNQRRLDELEDEVQNLKDLLNTQKEELLKIVENKQVLSDIESLKNEIKNINDKQSQKTEKENDISNSKIDSIETNLSNIKREIDTNINDQFNQYTEKLQSLENSMLSCINELNNEKEKVQGNTNQDTNAWPTIQVPAEKHEVNPLIGIIKEKIHALVDEMNQAPEQTDDTRIHKMKPSMEDTQENLKKLQETLNTLLIQDEYQTVQLNPQLMWNYFTELKDRVSVLEEKSNNNIKNRDIDLIEEEEEEKENDIDLLKQKVSELLGSQHQAINVINSQSSQIEQHTNSINDQLSRIEDLESSIQQLRNTEPDHGEIDSLSDEINELREALLSVQEENEKLKSQIGVLEEHSFSFLGSTKTSKREPNPVIVMLEAQVTELLQQMEDPSLREEPDETGELHPSMDQAERDLIAVQKTLRELLEQEEADAKHEAARAFNLINKHTQNRINHLENIIRKQNKTYQAVEHVHNELDSIKFRLNELSNSQKQVINVVNQQNNRIDVTKQMLARDVIPQLDDIHSQFDDHLSEHSLYVSQIPSPSKDSVMRHTPNPVVESLKEQINNLLEQIENPDVKSTCENEKSEKLKPDIEQLQKNLKILQDTLQRILSQQIYIPADEALRNFQDQIDNLQDKITKQVHDINELKRGSSEQLDERVRELEDNLSSLKAQCLENFSNNLYGDEIARSSEEIISLQNEVRQLRKDFEEATGQQSGFVSRSVIEQPVMKTTPEGHFIIKKTRHLNGTTNSNVEKLKNQIDRLNEEIRKTELDEEEDVDEIDDDLHSHLGKTSNDLLRLREQLQRILNGYEVEEVVPLSPQQMYENIVDLLRRVDRLEGKPPSQGSVISRGIGIEPEEDVLEKIQQLSSSYSTFVQTVNGHASHIHQMRESIENLEADLEEVRNQNRNGYNESLEEIKDELQRLKEQFDEFNDDYDVIEIEGDDADIQLDLEDDGENQRSRRTTDVGERGSKLKRLEARIAKLEKRLLSNNSQIFTPDGIPYSEGGFEEAANSSLFKTNPQIKAIQDQIDTLMKELNESEFDSEDDNKSHVKSNVEATKKQLKVLQDALQKLILEDQQERIRLATLSPQKLLYMLDELNAKFNKLPQDIGSTIDYLNSEVKRINEQVDENTNHIQDQDDQYNTLSNRVNEIIGNQNLLIQNSNQQNQKINLVTDFVEEFDTLKQQIEDLEDQVRNHIDDHDTPVGSATKKKRKIQTRTVKVRTEKEPNPFIKDVQDQIDALISNMNSLNEQQKQEENQDKELESRIIETENELHLLQETLRSLQEIELESEEIIEEEEDEDDDEVASSKTIKALKKSDGCLKFEVKRLKHNMQPIQSRDGNSNELNSKIDELSQRTNVSNNKINQLEKQITKLNKELTNQPEQILSSLQLLWSKKPKGTSKYAKGQKQTVNPVIKEIQDQIDELVSKMNDPSMMDEGKEDGELIPEIEKTQDELNQLRETLKELLEIEELNEEESESENDEGALYISPALVLSRLVKIEKEFMKNKEMEAAIHCIKHEIKKVKYQDSVLHTIKERTDALTQSQNAVIQGMNGLRSYVTSHHDEDIENEILDLKDRVDQLENQPPLPVPPSPMERNAQLPLGMTSGSSSRMIREIHKPRNVNPVIKEIQDQIDVLVRKMNDPSIKKGKEKGELSPRIAKSQAQLNRLRATLKRLQEMEDIEIVEDDISRAEDESFFNVPGSYLSKQLLVENVSYLNQRVNSVIIPALKCIKHELKNIKVNGIAGVRSRGINLEFGEEEKNDLYIKRIEEISSSQHQVVFNLNQLKQMIDQTNEKLESVQETIEEHIENGPEREINQRLDNVEEICDELQSGGGFFKGTTIKPHSKSKTVNPVIQLLKQRIDECVEQMNDPKLKENDELTNQELDPSLSKAENEVLILRETLRNLLEEEEEESEIVVTPESLYYMIKDLKERTALLETKAEEEKEERIQNLEENFNVLRTRSEELIGSHYKLIQSNNMNKSQIDKVMNQLTDDYNELDHRIASLEDGQVNLPDQMWSQSIIVRSPRTKKSSNPAIEKIKRKIDELVKEMNDPSIKDSNNSEQLKPDLEKAEQELHSLQQTLAAILEAEEEQTEEIITPDSLYQMVRDMQDKVSYMEDNNQNSILSRSILLSSPGKKAKKAAKKKYNNPELEVLRGRIDDLVEHMNDPEIEKRDKRVSDNSSKLKPSFNKAENELHVLRDTLSALIEETEEEAEDDEELVLTPETLPEFLLNLRNNSRKLDKSIHCLKYELKKLKSSPLLNRSQATEEELMSYCDRLEGIAQNFDKHIIEAKKELKKFRQVKSTIMKESELTNSIKCLKHEVKLLKLDNKPSSRSRRSGHNDKDNNNNNAGYGNDNDNDDDGGNGPNNRRPKSKQSSGKNKSSRSNKAKTLEERVDIIEESQDKTIQNVNAQHSYLAQIQKVIQQFQERLDEQQQQQPIGGKVTKRSISGLNPLDEFEEDEEDRIRSLESRINELTSSQSSVINCCNAQNEYIQQMKDQLEDLLSKQDEEEDKRAIQSRSVNLQATDEDAQNSIKCLKYEMKKLKERMNNVNVSQNRVIQNSNAQTEHIHLVEQKIDEILAKQEQDNNNLYAIEDVPQIDEMMNEIETLKENMKAICSQLNELTNSQKIVIDNSNNQTDCIHQIKDTLIDLAAKQEQLERQIEEENSIIQTDENVLNDLKCLKYEVKQLKNNGSNNDDINYQINEIKASQKQVIDDTNAQASAIRQMKEILNDILLKQKQLENKEAEIQQATLDDETTKLKKDMIFIDERINQISSSQKMITDNVNSQVSHLRQIHEKLNEIIEKQNEYDSNQENLSEVQTREITLSSSDLQTRIDEISSAQSAVVNTLNAQKSQIDQIKDRLNETISNQSQIMENTENLIEEQNSNNKYDYQLNTDQLLRIEKELTELQKNHLYLRSQFYDHLKENNNEQQQQLISSVNELNKQQKHLISTTDDLSSSINDLEDKLSAQERKIKDLQNNKNRNFDNSELNSIQDLLNQISASQNQVIQTVNTQSGHIRNQENEIHNLKEKVHSMQQNPQVNDDEIELLQQDIERLKRFEYETTKELEELKNDLNEKQPQVIDRSINLNKEPQQQIQPFDDSQIKEEIEFIKGQLEKLSNDHKYESEIKKIKSKVNSIEDFNHNQLVPHINHLEENFELIQKMKDKIRKLNENDQKIVQHLEKQKQDIRQFNEILNFSPFLISSGNKQHKKNLQSFFECVADTLNNHSSLLVEIDQRLATQENNNNQYQYDSPIPTPTTNKTPQFKDDTFVSTGEFQKFANHTNSLIEQLAKKLSKSTSSSLELKKEIDSIKINTLKNNLGDIDEVDDNQSENRKLDSLLSRVVKLEQQFANKSAEIDSKNNEVDELKKFTNKVAKLVKSQEEKIKNIRETMNNK